MVQLSAAGLGLPSNNAGPSIAEGLRMGTQGFMQGAQLAMQQKESQAKQAAYEQALKEAIYKHGQEQSQAQAQKEAGALQGSLGGLADTSRGDALQQGVSDAATAPLAAGVGAVFGKGIGDILANPISHGLKSAAQPLGQKLDYDALLQHQQYVMKQAGDIAGRLAPQYQEKFWNDINAGMKQDAMNLQRAHVADTLHDAALHQGNTVDPQTGAMVINEEIQKHISQMADDVRSGKLDPSTAEAWLSKFRDDNLNHHVIVKQRVDTANKEDLTAQGLRQQGMPVNDDYLKTIQGYRDGSITKQEYDSKIQHYRAGDIEYKFERLNTLLGGKAEKQTMWVKPDMVPQMQNIENLLIQGEVLKNQHVGAEADQAESIADYNKFWKGQNQAAAIAERGDAAHARIVLGGKKLDETTRHNKAGEGLAASKQIEIDKWRAKHAQLMGDANYVRAASAASVAAEKDPDYISNKATWSQTMDKIMATMMPPQQASPKNQTALERAKAALGGK